MAKRFDYLIFTIELAIFLGKNFTKAKNEVITTADALAKLGAIPQVTAEKEIIDRVRKEHFWRAVTLPDLEEVREALRDLIKFIEQERQKIYYTDFTDEILGVVDRKSTRLNSSHVRI